MLLTIFYRHSAIWFNMLGITFDNYEDAIADQEFE